MFTRLPVDANFETFIFLAQILLALPFLYMAGKFLTPFGLIERNVPKLSAYECGFNPFSLRRTQIDIKFFLLGLLFLVFDIEILLLLPFVVSLYNLSFFELVITIFFLILVGLGIVWEIISGIMKFT